jgi:hypothetical protein
MYLYKRKRMKLEIGSIPLKDPKVRYIPLTTHIIDSCEPHISLTCNDIYLNLGSFNGMDPNPLMKLHPIGIVDLADSSMEELKPWSDPCVCRHQSCVLPRCREARPHHDASGDAVGGRLCVWRRGRRSPPAASAPPRQRTPPPL